MRNFNLPKKLMVLAVICTFIFTAGFSQSDDWEVPEEYTTMANPTEASDENMVVGKELWAKFCKSCHGKFGEGDGPKAEELDTEMGDFTEEGFQGQSTGSMFYKTKFGRDDMPSFEKKIPDDEDLWLIVNYLRTLGE